MGITWQEKISKVGDGKADFPPPSRLLEAVTS
jgi:hypothetical protein